MLRSPWVSTEAARFPRGESVTVVTGASRVRLFPTEDLPRQRSEEGSPLGTRGCETSWGNRPSMARDCCFFAGGRQPVPAGPGPCGAQPARASPRRPNRRVNVPGPVPVLGSIVPPEKVISSAMSPPQSHRIADQASPNHTMTASAGKNRRAWSVERYNEPRNETTFLFASEAGWR
jgi:hypothetical protein